MTAPPPASSPAPCPTPADLPLLALQQDAPVLIALFDPQDRLQWANTAFRRSYGLGPEEGITWDGLMRRNHAQRVGAYIQNPDIDAWLLTMHSRRGKTPLRAFEADLCDGRWLWVTETVRADGWLLCMATDITELRRDSRHLRRERDQALRAAQTDALTGISNRAHILQLLEHHLAAQRTGGPACGLVLLDLDRFKAVNDSHGHMAGDQVLCNFAATVLTALRRGDGFGRIGGEEFLLLLPGSDPAAVHSIVERLLARVRDQRPLDALPGFAYGCSAGLTMLRPTDSARTAYQRADQALYAAKTAGRDRARWAPPPAPPADPAG